ncbi:MAG: hypothetical protein RI924_747 [Bacteroidota bacterium]|jgi:hypothetical protein
MKRLILLFGVSILLLACNRNEIPEGILSEKEMKAVLKDIHLTDAYLNTIADLDSVKKVSSGYYQTVFKKHQIDLTKFEKSLKYYALYPVLLDSMYSQINAEYEKKLKVQQKPVLKNAE